MLEKIRSHLPKNRKSIIAAGSIVAAVVVAASIFFFTKKNSTAEASIQPVAARFDQIDGSVGIARVNADDQQLAWSEATMNMPVTVGDRIYARDAAKASIALTGKNSVRLNPQTTLDMLTLGDRRTQLALRSGSAVFDVGALSGDDFFEVATPCGAVDLKEPGLYQIGMDGDNAVISVLRGEAQVVGLEGTGLISQGQVYTLYPQGSAEQATSGDLSPDVAGTIVDGYYRDRYPRTYDGRYRRYDAYLGNPDYYDPYDSSVSYRYVSADVPGLYDLDYYGDWVDVADYGYCWAPRVSSGWAPFRSGYWDFDDLLGASWVSAEPWGWAPYHYGRWAFLSDRWYWVPREVRTYDYCPATVAFFPYQDEFAWVPLAPGEVFVPRYYDVGFRPVFLASRDVINVASVQRTFVNFAVPGAVTVVPVRSLSGVIDPTVVTRFDAQQFQETRQVIDPFSVAGVRELALRKQDARRAFNLSRSDREVFNRAVVTSSTPEVSRWRSDIAKSVRVESVSDNQRKNKLRVDKTGTVSSVRSDGLPQSGRGGSNRMNELATRADQGDKSARRELRQMMREQEQQRLNQPKSSGQPQTVNPQQDLSRKELRQQRKAAQQQTPQQQISPDQNRQQRRLERQQQPTPQSQQQTPRQQLRQQRRLERQQQDAGRHMQQQQMRQQQQRPQQQMRPQSPQQTPRQLRKEQKRRPPEASASQMRQLNRAAQFDSMRRDQARQAQMARQAQAARQSQVSRQNEQFRMQRQRQDMQQRQAQESRRQAVIQQRQIQSAQRQNMMRQQYQIQQQAQRQNQRQVFVQQQQAARSAAVQRQQQRQVLVQQQQQAARSAPVQRQQQVSPQPMVRQPQGQPANPGKGQRKHPQ